MDINDLVIIGAGPAGLTAALYAGRYRLSTVLLEKLTPGGQIILSPAIENFPGSPGAVPTFELVERMKKQAEEVGVCVTSDDATELTVDRSSSEPVFTVTTPSQSFRSKAVIIATGAFPRRLDVRDEERLTGKGVSYCATCDGPLFKDKEIAVVGGGDRAVEEALFLARYAKQVTLIHRRRELRASKILQEKAFSHPKIKMCLDSVIQNISGKERVDTVSVKDVKSGSVTHMSIDGIFVCIGIRPNTQFLKNVLKADDNGFIITDQDMNTSQAGVYACGDCRLKSLYQVTTACGEAAVAVFSAQKYLVNR